MVGLVWVWFGMVGTVITVRDMPVPYRCPLLCLCLPTTCRLAALLFPLWLDGRKHLPSSLLLFLCPLFIALHCTLHIAFLLFVAPSDYSHLCFSFTCAVLLVCAKRGSLRFFALCLRWLLLPTVVHYNCHAFPSHTHTHTCDALLAFRISGSQSHYHLLPTWFMLLVLRLVRWFLYQFSLSLHAFTFG